MTHIEQARAEVQAYIDNYVQTTRCVDGPECPQIASYRKIVKLLDEAVEESNQLIFHRVAKRQPA